MLRSGVPGGREWVNGLIVGDEFIERITMNVLDRFSGERRT